MRQYLDLLQYILDNGIQKSDRTGVGTLSVFGYQMRFDLQKGFPLLILKTSMKYYLCFWFIRGY